MAPEMVGNTYICFLVACVHKEIFKEIFPRNHMHPNMFVHVHMHASTPLVILGNVCVCVCVYACACVNTQIWHGSHGMQYKKTHSCIIRMNVSLHVCMCVYTYLSLCVY